jgi:hypothetical protein
MRPGLLNFLMTTFARVRQSLSLPSAKDFRKELLAANIEKFTCKRKKKKK